MDYFTKWVKTNDFVDITVNKVISFLWKNIIYQFELSKILITNNRMQFDNHKMREQCQRLNIDHRIFWCYTPKPMANQSYQQSLT